MDVTHGACALARGDKGVNALVLFAEADAADFAFHHFGLGFEQFLEPLLPEGFPLFSELFGELGVYWFVGVGVEIGQA